MYQIYEVSCLPKQTLVRTNSTFVTLQFLKLAAMKVSYKEYSPLKHIFVFDKYWFRNKSKYVCCSRFVHITHGAWSNVIRHEGMLNPSQLWEVEEVLHRKWGESGLMGPAIQYSLSPFKYSNLPTFSYLIVTHSCCFMYIQYKQWYTYNIIHGIEGNLLMHNVTQCMRRTAG